jgi:hypothetical protein
LPAIVTIRYIAGDAIDSQGHTHTAAFNNRYDSMPSLGAFCLKNTELHPMGQGKRCARDYQG